MTGPERWVGFDYSWYPARKRHAPRPLVSLQLQRRRGRLRPYVRLCVHPGLTYELNVGLHRRHRR